MAENLEEIEVTLIDEKVQFSGVSKNHPELPVIFDYKAPMGNGQGFNGLELLLMSLSGCSATAVVYLLRKMKKNIASFKVKAQGIRSTEMPIKFDLIRLTFIVESDNTNDTELNRSIQMAEESICPVWQMIKNNVKVETEFSILWLNW